MSAFGTHLKLIRKRCADPDKPGSSLTQERLGELLGGELGLNIGFSGAAVSDWERGKSRIRADDRLVLVNMLMIFQRYGGIHTIAEANELLEKGNYRALNPVEIEKVFSEAHEPEDANSQLKGDQDITPFSYDKLFFISGDELRALLEKAKEGPSPAWPRILVALLRTVTDRWSAIHFLKALRWTLIWLASWGMLIPSLRWPFASQGQARTVTVLSTGASLALPLLIGLFTNTRDNEFWQNHNLANAKVTRLYTYQGAFVGFHLGYFVAFAVSLLRYYLQLHLALWFELMLMAIPVLTAYMGARLVPYNLWQAYKRLSLTDGSIFFFFILLGPLWGFFFGIFYPVILAPVPGGIVILFAITLLAVITAWQFR